MGQQRSEHLAVRVRERSRPNIRQYLPELAGDIEFDYVVAIVQKCIQRQLVHVGQPALVANDVEESLPEVRKRCAVCEHAKHEADELLMSDIASTIKQDLADLLYGLGTCKRSEGRGGTECRIEPEYFSMQGRQELVLLGGREFADVAVQGGPGRDPVR